jgi:hypothetical protein
MTVKLQTLQSMGTREVGERARGQVLELLQSGQDVQIDFKQSAKITPSFADEFVGKLVAEIGLEKFRSSVELVNVNPEVESLIHVAIARRLRGVVSA